MTLHVFSVAHNEAQLVPFFVRHYRDYWRADQITVFDHDSDDSTAALLRAEGVDVRPVWPGLAFDETRLLELANTCWMGSAADWVIFCGFDELLYIPAPADYLRYLDRTGADCAQAIGWVMVSDHFPQDDGRQLWQLVPDGVKDVYSDKVSLFRPTIELVYGPGCHKARTPDAVRTDYRPDLLHYRWFGADYYAKRNAATWARTSAENKENGSGFHMSPERTRATIEQMGSNPPVLERVVL